MGNLGNAYRDLGGAFFHIGQVETAVNHLRQALTIFSELKHPDAEKLRDWINSIDTAAS